MAKILMLVSSAKVIRLADGTPQPTGYFVEEAIKPYDRFIAAGAEVVVTTADGQTPHSRSVWARALLPLPRRG